MIVRRKNPNERGFFTIWILGLCVVLFFIGGIALDLWKGFATRRDLAEIADSAAVAGASKIDLNCYKTSQSLVLNSSDDGCDSDGSQPIDPETAIDRANTYIDQATEQENVTLTARDVEIDNGQLQVTLSEDSSTTLTRIFSPTQNYTVTVHSAATPELAQ